MTTTHEQTPFLPKKLVPVGESIIVHYSGKPPKVSTRQYNGEDIKEVTFWLGIADKGYPDLIGQYHRFITRTWISGPRPARPHDDPPRKAIQASKLYNMIQSVAGDEAAKRFDRHDASLDINAPELDPDNENVDEEKRSKAIPPEWWKALRGFYVAIFKEPRRDKETGEPMIADDGGIFWQEILELKPLKSARIFSQEQLLENITWPPPKADGTPAGPAPLGLPKANQTPPKAEAAAKLDEPRASQKPPQDPAPPQAQRSEVAERHMQTIRGYWDRKNGFRSIITVHRLAAHAETVDALEPGHLRNLVAALEMADKFAAKRHLTSLEDLDEKDKALLKLLLQILALRTETPAAGLALEAYLHSIKLELHELDETQAEAVHTDVKRAADDDGELPF